MGQARARGTFAERQTSSIAQLIADTKESELVNIARKREAQRKEQEYLDKLSEDERIEYLFSVKRERAKTMQLRTLLAGMMVMSSATTGIRT